MLLLTQAASVWAIIACWYNKSNGLIYNNFKNSWLASVSALGFWVGVNEFKIRLNKYC